MISDEDALNMIEREVELVQPVPYAADDKLVPSGTVGVVDGFNFDGQLKARVKFRGFYYMVLVPWGKLKLVRPVIEVEDDT